MRGSWVNIQSRGLEEVTLLAALGGNNSDSFCDSDLQSKDMLQMFFLYTLVYVKNRTIGNRYDINVILETTI